MLHESKENVMIQEWLRKTRSLRHDVYEVLIWVVAIGAVAYYVMGGCKCCGLI